MASQGSAGVRKEARTPAPYLSQAIRALQLMLKHDCNVGHMEDPPYGSCGVEAHQEAREIIAAYKKWVLAQMAQQ